MEKEYSDEFSSFLVTGIYRLENSSNAVFMDPVRVLNSSYTHFRVSPSKYYSRFERENRDDERVKIGVSFSESSSRKRKRRKKTSSYVLNEREQSAERRHQEARPFLLKAHGAFLGATDLLDILCNLRKDGFISTGDEGLSNVGKDTELSFIELGRIWQTPLYEISLYPHIHDGLADNKGAQFGPHVIVPLFNNLITNEADDDIEAEFLNSWYILPRKSCFHMSDVGQIHNLVPVQLDPGFNLLVIDPPWENKNVHQKSVYPTLPNWHLFSLPIKQLAHSEGALVALWVTNREKLRVFVEEELFPAWGVTPATLFYWLKVKRDGSLISELDLFHHKPYECLHLGYIYNKEMHTEAPLRSKSLQGNQVIISIPGDHSRKPPLGNLLADYIPGPQPARCLELFARELVAGWTSWGNEPLRFQNLNYFTRKTTGL